MPKNLISASIIAGGLLIWLSSGLFFEGRGDENHSVRGQQEIRANSPANDARQVRAAVSVAEQRIRSLVLRGRTQSKRTVDVKAEIAGQVVARPSERGEAVQRGDLLCQLSIDDRDASVSEAQAALEEAEIEYQGTLKLKEKGLQSRTAIARAGARLEAARANLRRQNLNLERTRIVAPFDGVVEQFHMNVGDYATPGAACARLIDLDPMLVTADVTEAEVENIQAGDKVVGYTSTGSEIIGELTFIGKQSDPLTRTYSVEITISNPDYSLRSGLTTTAHIEFDHVLAHRISPALFTLNDRGDLGVRTVGEGNIVEFHPVSVIEDTPDGVWVTGLPARVKLITIGQEYVLAGQGIKPVYPQVSAVEPGAQ